MRRKRNVILSSTLLLVLTSCANNVEVSESVNQSVNQVISPTSYDFKKIGEVDYKVRIQYDDIYTIYKDGLMGYIDSDGNVLCEPKYLWVGYGDGMLSLEEKNDDGTIKKYFQSLDGKVTIDKVNGLEIESYNNFNEGYAVVRLINENGEPQNSTKIIDKQGHVALETDIPDSFYNIDKDGNYVLSNATETLQVYNKDLTPYTKEEMSSDENLDGDDVFLRDGVYILADKSDYVALYDNENKKAISDYNIAFGPMKVGENYLLGTADTPNSNPTYKIMNDKYEVVTEIEYNFDYSALPQVINDKIVLTLVGSKIRILDENGGIYKEANYSSISQYRSGTILCVANGKEGILDNEFNEVVAPEYDSITPIYDGVGLALKDNILYKITANYK